MQERRLDLGRHLAEEPAPGMGRWRWERPLPLETDGHLRVIALGTGSAFSTTRGQSNFILVKGATVVFVDLGTQASLRMAALGIPMTRVDHVVITHSHADHIGGLEELAARRRYELPLLSTPPRRGEGIAAHAERVAAARRSGRYRPKLHVPEFYAAELWESSLRGGLRHCEAVEDGEPDGAMTLAHFFEVVPMAPRPGAPPSWEARIGGIDLVAFETRHAPDDVRPGAPRMHSVGLVVDGRLWISGDTQFDPANLDAFGQGAEAFFHEVQHFAGGVHTWYGDLKGLPAAVKDRMYLYHLTEGMVQVDPVADGFAGFLRPAPWVYDF